MSSLRPYRHELLATVPLDVAGEFGLQFPALLHQLPPLVSDLYLALWRTKARIASAGSYAPPPNKVETVATVSRPKAM